MQSIFWENLGLHLHPQPLIVLLHTMSINLPFNVFFVLQNFPRRSTVFIFDLCYVFFLFFFTTLPRMLMLSFGFSFLHRYFWILICIFAVCALIMYIPYYKYGKRALLGVALSFFGPCIILDDFSYFFLYASIISSTLYLAMTIALPFVGYHLLNLEYVKPPKLFSNLYDENKYSKVPLGDMLQNMESISSLFSDHPMLYLNMGLVVLWICSIISAFLLHFYIDPIHRLKASTSKWISWFKPKPSWNPEHIVWLPFIQQLLVNPKKLFECIDGRAQDVLGLSLLEFSVQNGYFHLTKVHTYQL